MSVRAITWAWDQQVNKTEKLILLALADHANDEDACCWPSLSFLAKKTCCSRATVVRSINSLVMSGRICRRDDVSKWGTTIYVLSFPLTSSTVRLAKALPSLTVRRGVVSQCDTEPSIEPSEESYICRFFDSLWSDYNQKTGQTAKTGDLITREAASKAYFATVKTSADLSDIYKALENYEKHLSVNLWKTPRAAVTWFRSWREWVSFVEPEPKEKTKAKPGVVLLARPAVPTYHGEGVTHGCVRCGFHHVCGRDDCSEAAGGEAGLCDACRTVARVMA